MHKWNLAPGLPMNLGLATDIRFSSLDPNNDHIWEIRLAGNEPSAIVLQTTYGLRARSMRLFPRFTCNDITLSDPLQFHLPPHLDLFYANYLNLGLCPFPGIGVCLEYWVPESNAICGRITLTNQDSGLKTMDMEWLCILNPLGEGQKMTIVQSAMTHILQGTTTDLAPVFFLTGGPSPSEGAYPGLKLHVDLQPRDTRTLNWALVSMGNMDKSLEKARRLTARPWDAEISRVVLQNLSDSIQISTGIPEWDVAFELSQKTANSLFLAGNQRVPNPTFVLSRQIDHGYSVQSDGSNHTHLWSGQTALDTFYLAYVVPAQQQRLRGLLRNFIASPESGDNLDFRVSLFFPPTRHLAQPVLCALAWQLAGDEPDKIWIEEVYQPLSAFFYSWFSPSQDLDQDLFPEWSHPIQTGLEHAPIYDCWHGGAGVDTKFIESPGLAAMLFNEAQYLLKMALLLGRNSDLQKLEQYAEDLKLNAQSTWNNNSSSYHYRDAITHLSPSNERIISFNGSGKIKIQFKSHIPLRLMVNINIPPEISHNISIRIHGQTRKGFLSEIITPRNWFWSEKQAFATSQNTFIAVRQLEVTGLPQEGIGWLSSCGYHYEDCSLFLPLWAGIPTKDQADQMAQTLFERYAGPFGIPVCPSNETSSANLVLMIFNTMLAEGLLHYGMRQQAAELFTRWMQGILSSLRQFQSFYASFTAQNGQVSGENNALRGLLPLKLFLEIVGIRSIQKNRVVLEGTNPFPHPITVKYQGMTITRNSENSIVTFPNGQTVTIKNDQDQIVAL